MRFIWPALLLLGCATAPATSTATAQQLNKDKRYAHSSDGEVIMGPSDINQRVVGQIDAAGNVHVTTDRWFLTRADELSCAQMALAQLAATRAASPQVSQTAYSLASDQQRIDERVRSLAARRNLRLQSQLAPSEQAIHQQLASLYGEDFDRAYLRASLDLQQQQLALWDDALRSSGDRELAQFAFETQPTLQAGHALAARTVNRL